MSFLSFNPMHAPLSRASKTTRTKGSMRSAFAEWILRNHGREYIDALRKQRGRRASKTFGPVLESCGMEAPTNVPMVGIVGGGFAGLYAGLILQSLGIEFEILEASDRVGGRIHTWYSTEYDEDKKEVSGLYGEVGGMRLPQFSADMLPVQELALVVNAVLQRSGMEDKMVYWRKFYYDSPVQRLRFNDMKRPITKTELGKIKLNAPNPLRFGEKQDGDVPAVWMTATSRPEKTKYLDANVPYYPADLALSIVMTKYINLIDESFEKGFTELMKYDQYSMWGYLTTVFTLGEMGVYYDEAMGKKGENLPFSVASYLETTNVGSGMYSVSFVEIILAAYDWGGSRDPYRPSDPNIYMLTALQGMQRLPDACRAVLDMQMGVREADGQTAQIQLGILAGPDGKTTYSPPNLTKDAQPLPPETGSVPAPTVYSKVPVEKAEPKQRVFLKQKVLGMRHDPTLYKGHGGMRLKVGDQSAVGKGKVDEKQYPYVITTLPNGMYLSGDRRFNVLNDLSFKKALALRECTYMPSFKAFLTFKTQFWAKLGQRQDAGLGAASTDRPNRQIIYPSYGYDARKGVLQVYCWAEDAKRLGALSDEERVNECLKGIAYLYPEVDVLAEFAGYSPEKTTKTWYWDQHAGGGAFALFSPGQFKNIYPTLLTPEFDGCLNFAGECCSVHHGWIVGALDSAYNAVVNILRLAGAEGKIEQIENTWGKLTTPNVDTSR